MGSGRETEAQRREGTCLDHWAPSGTLAGCWSFMHARASQLPIQALPSEDPLHWATYLPFLVADSPVELLALKAQEVLPRMDDATLDGDGPGCVDIVTSDHADSDACSLALADGFRDLGGRACAMEWTSPRAGPPCPHGFQSEPCSQATPL